MIHIDWNPVAHLGPIPINWYGLGWAVAFLVGGVLSRRWAAREGIQASVVEDVIVWVLIGSLMGARLYFFVQNDPAVVAPVLPIAWIGPSPRQPHHPGCLAGFVDKI